MFVCYSPYHRTNSGPPSGVTEADVEADMKIVAAHFTQIRTYGVDAGNQWNADKALKNGIREMAVDLGHANNAPATNKQIDLALSQLDAAAKKYGGFAHLDLVIGNEVDRTDVAVYTPADIQNGMAYAKQAVQKYPTLDSVYVTTCLQRHRPGTWPERGQVAAGGRLLRRAHLADGLSVVRRRRSGQHRQADAMVVGQRTEAGARRATSRS